MTEMTVVSANNRLGSLACCLVFGAALAVVLVAAFSPAGAASIVKKDGTVLQGDIAGTVVLIEENSTCGKAIDVIEGKDIINIDERGVRLKPNSVVLFTGMAVMATPAEYRRSIEPVNLLKVVLPASAKKEPVPGEELNKNAFLKAFIHGTADGPGFGSVGIGKGRAFFLKRFTTEAPSSPIAGELLKDRGKYRITPTLRVHMSSGVVSLPVDSIKPIQAEKKRSRDR